MLIGCTAANTVNLGGKVTTTRDILITTGDLDRPYRSIGVTQVSNSGVWLLGFIEIMPARLEDALRDNLANEADKFHADAVINVQFYEMQYPPLIKLLSVLSIISPQYSIATGELVEFVQ